MTVTRDPGKSLRGGFNPGRILLLLGPLIYLAYALLTPPFQTPDEHQHLFRAYQLASFDLLGERRGDASGEELPAGLGRAALPELGTIAPHARRGNPQRPWSDMFSRATPVGEAEPPRFTNFLGSVVYSPAGYVPQVVAVWIGMALDLSVESILRLGRMLNAAAALALLLASIRLIPVGKLVVLVVALMPMTAATAASFGQDGLIIGGSALIVAVALRSWSKGRWPRRDLAVMAVATIFVTLAKMVYLPLALTALLPVPRSSSKLAWMAPPLLIAAAAALLLGLWLSLTSHLVVRMLDGAPEPGEQLRYVFAHPLVFLKALIGTYVSDGIGLALSLFSFGWLSVGPVLPAAALAFAGLGAAVLAGDREAGELGMAWRGWALLLAAGIVVLLSLALYLAATPLGAPSITGLQGRYFLPILPLVGIALLPAVKTARPRIALSAVALIAASNLAALLAIAGAYYRM